MKCANCANEAKFSVDSTATASVNYCQDCLPKHLRTRRHDNRVDISKKSSEPIIEQQAEPVAEEAPKRSRKKAAAPEPVEEPTPELVEEPTTEPVSEPVDEDL